MTEARARVLDLLKEGPSRTAAEIEREAGISAGVVRGLASHGAIEAVSIRDVATFDRPDTRSAGPTLSEAQRRGAEALSGALANSAFSVTVLDGVTGAGKTEVYFEAIAAALDAGDQVLVMLPEIALSAQWLGRFRARFGVAPAVWHSELGTRRRRETWRAVAESRAQVVVGARSALWLPFRSLGLIVVDEEHDTAFKQEDGVVYHARDMAVVRARLEDCPAVLVSATPSLETVVNVEKGRYASVLLPDRHGGAQLPSIETVDLRETPPERGAWLAPVLRAALAETLDAGEQALLFLNRRGLRAADAVPGLRSPLPTARIAAPGWWSTASALRSSATTAIFGRRSPNRARPARRRGASRPAARGSRGSRRRWTAHSPAPAGWSSPAIRWAAPVRCRTWSMPSRPMRSMC